MPPLSAVPTHFFFYGTLVAGNPNPVAMEIHAQLERLGAATAHGALYAVRDPSGWFPALLPGGEAVRGQLYSVAAGFDAALLARMDAYEDFDPGDPAGSLYRRETLAVECAGIRVEAAAYLWNRALPEGAEPITEGSFADWLAKTGNPVFSATRSA